MRPSILSDEKHGKPKSVGVLVLNWNGQKLLEQFIANWIALTPSYAELVIVDNGSTDGSLSYLAEHHPEVKCLALGANYGFAEGYNRAIATLDYPIAVLLNSDVALHRDWLDEPMQLLKEYSDVVAIQPKIRAYHMPESFEYAGAAGGYLDALGYPYCAGRIFDSIELDHGQYDSPRSLMWASGACLIVRRADYLAVGGLDAGFFAHQEEIDLCWRLRARGGKILLAPQSLVYHVGGASLNASSPKKTYLNFRNNLLMLYKNMPTLALMRTLTLRLVLDLVAMLRYLLARQWGHAGAILRAWCSAVVMAPSYKKARQENLRLSRTPNKAILSPTSIVWQYYVLGRTKYSELH